MHNRPTRFFAFRRSQITTKSGGRERENGKSQSGIYIFEGIHLVRARSRERRDGGSVCLILGKLKMKQLPCYISYIRGMS